MKSDSLPETKTNDVKEPDWKQLCSDLQRERDELLRTIRRIEEERDQYLKSLYAYTRKDVDFDRDDILAHAGKRPTLRDLIAEFEQANAAQTLPEHAASLDQTPER